MEMLLYCGGPAFYILEGTTAGLSQQYSPIFLADRVGNVMTFSVTP